MSPHMGRDLIVDRLAHDEHGFVEPAGKRGERRIVHEGFAAWTDGRELLQATEATAMTRSKDDELHRRILNPLVENLMRIR